MPRLIKTYTLCPGQIVTEEIGQPLTGFSPDPLPDWFTLIENSSGDVIGWQIVADEQTDTEISFIINLPDFVDPNQIEAKIRVQVSADFCPTVYEVCCDDVCNIGWWNPIGGFQNYIFEGVKEFTRSIGNRNEYKQDNIKHYSRVDEVFRGKRCSTRSIPKSHVKQILDSLYSAIQAYEFNPETGNWDIPIQVQKSRYERYNSREKIFERDVVFIYSEEEIIQGQ